MDSRTACRQPSLRGAMMPTPDADLHRELKLVRCPAPPNPITCQRGTGGATCVCAINKYCTSGGGCRGTAACPNAMADGSVGTDTITAQDAAAAVASFEHVPPTTTSSSQVPLTNPVYLTGGTHTYCQ